ncbi:hypothetical protein ABPG72_018692 [Tetrahymena utriculariae]
MKKGQNFISTLCFEDESYLFSEKQGRKWIRKFKDEKWDEEQFQERIKKHNGGLSVFVYGIISKSGKRKLVWVNENGKNVYMNSQKYIEVLKTQVVNHIKVRPQNNGKEYIYNQIVLYSNDYGILQERTRQRYIKNKMSQVVSIINRQFRFDCAQCALTFWFKFAHIRILILIKNAHNVRINPNDVFLFFQLNIKENYSKMQYFIVIV